MSAKIVAAIIAVCVTVFAIGVLAWFANQAFFSMPNEPVRPSQPSNLPQLQQFPLANEAADQPQVQTQKTKESASNDPNPTDGTSPETTHCHGGTYADYKPAEEVPVDRYFDALIERIGGGCTLFNADIVAGAIQGDTFVYLSNARCEGFGPGWFSFVQKHEHSTVPSETGCYRIGDNGQLFMKMLTDTTESKGVPWLNVTSIFPTEYRPD